ncbi:MAG TPA: TonB-dependent receptor [Bryobacteraceae bacterium]|nr:TonB-dependent receptor [Bryobacteraceae bacterium]
MAFQRIRSYFLGAILASTAVLGLSAAEHRGAVRFGGLAVPGATVTATQGDKKLVAVTDSEGAYDFSNLADGVWSMTVEMLCFKTEKRDVGVAAGAPAAVWDLKLLPLDQLKAAATAAPPLPAPAPPSGQTAAASQQSSVAAPTPSLAAVMGETPAPARGKNAKSSKNDKNNKKSANATPADSQAGFQRADVNASANAAPPQDMASSLAPADAGNNASDAFVLNGSTSNRIESRAIGNARRGMRSMYNFNVGAVVDNSALNASPFSLTGQPTPKPDNSHVQLMGSAGGPLYIPHVLHSNGQFYFGYQYTRNRNASTQSGLMPTDAERGGDFSGAVNALGQPVVLYDPTTHLPIPNNNISGLISPQAQALLKLYPRQGFAESAGFNYQAPIVSASDSNGVTSRLSRTLNNKNFVNGQFSWQGTSGSNPNLFNFTDANKSSGLRANGTLRHIFTTRFNASLNYEYSRLDTRLTPYFANRAGGNIEGNAGITGVDATPNNWGPPALNFTASGITALSDGQESFTRNQTNALGFSGLWMPRPHNITFGADFRRQQFNYLSQNDPRGTFTFTGAATGQTVNGVVTPGTGSDFADFLLGIPDAASIAFGNADKYLRGNLWDAYVTDDWRLGPTITVNIGVRWDYSSPVSELYGRLVNLDVAPGFTAIAPVLGNNPNGAVSHSEYPASLVRPDRRGFQPRLAFAWHPLAGSSMVIRGGYGIYYNTSVYQSIAAQMMQQSPLSKSLSVQNSAANPLTLANGFYTPPASTPNTFAIDPNFRPGYAHNWQVSLQRDLTASTVMTVTYLGVKGVHAVQEFLPNTYPAGAANPCPTCTAGYLYMTSNGNSTREAGSIQLRRRMHNGFATSGQYTYSRSFDDAALGGRGQGSAVIAQNWLNLSAERGPSSFDQRHALSATAQYTSGMGLGGGTLLSGWVGRVVKGWTFSTTLTAGTGLPLTPAYGQTVPGTGVSGPIRPDATGAPLYAAPAGRHLNPGAYMAPPAGQWGNAGRNSITGPSQLSLNASMGRSFTLGGGNSFNGLDVRFDSNNVLNNVTFPSWNAIITSAQFGLPTTANAMRVVQATVRYRF